MFRMRSDLSEASSVMVKRREREGSREAEQRERGKSWFTYQEEWALLFLPLAAGNTLKRRKRGRTEGQMLVNPLIDKNNRDHSTGEI